MTGEAVLNDTDYHFVFTAEAFIMAEKLLGVGTMELIDKAVDGRGGFNEIQVLLHCAMEAHRRRFHPSAKVIKPARVLDIITDAGGFMVVLPQVSASMLASPALGLRNATRDDEEDDAAESEADDDDAVPFDGTTSSPEPSEQEPTPSGSGSAPSAS